MRKPDGSIRIRRSGTSRLYGFAPLVMSLLLVWTLQPVIPCFLARHSALGYGMTGIFASVALGSFCFSLWLFSYREEWEARPGILAIHRAFCGIDRVTRFTNPTFRIQLRSVPRSGDTWFLSVETPKQRRDLASSHAMDPEDWKATAAGRLADLLAAATRFPLHVDGDGLGSWLAGTAPGLAADGRAEIRHRRLGHILEQVPGDTLVGARLTWARLGGADLQGADLRGADLAMADLRGASLRHANLASARLHGADLTGADLTGATLLGASYDAATRWPQGFDPRQHKAVLAQ